MIPIRRLRPWDRQTYPFAGCAASSPAHLHHLRCARKTRAPGGRSHSPPGRDIADDRVGDGGRVAVPTADERLATIWIVSSLAWSAIPSATTDDPETSWLILVLNPSYLSSSWLDGGSYVCSRPRASRGLTPRACCFSRGAGVSRRMPQWRHFRSSPACVVAGDGRHRSLCTRWASAARRSLLRFVQLDSGRWLDLSKHELLRPWRSDRPARAIGTIEASPKRSPVLRRREHECDRASVRARLLSAGRERVAGVRAADSSPPANAVAHGRRRRWLRDAYKVTTARWPFRCKFASGGAESLPSRLQLVLNRLAPGASGWLDPAAAPDSGPRAGCAFVTTSRGRGISALRPLLLLRGGHVRWAPRLTRSVRASSGPTVARRLRTRGDRGPPAKRGGRGRKLPAGARRPRLSVA